MINLFVLGRESELSLAEITQVLRAYHKKFEALAGTTELAVLDIDGMDKGLFDRCGGLIKYGSAKEVSVRALDEAVRSLIESRLPASGRLSFGISVYPASPEVTRKHVRDTQEQMKLLGMTIKQSLKARGLSARFVISEEPQLSSVVVQKNHLVTEKGIEVLVGLDAHRAFVGATQAVQNFEAFGHRDMQRPFRDDVSGMLPPKLARMMVNLSGVAIGKQTVLLDPFCGSGTVLQEALLLGAGKVLGSDASAKAVHDAQGNIDWLRLQRKDLGESRIEQVDAKDIASWLPASFVDVVVTEPYLGEPVRASVKKAEAIRRQAELSVFYDDALKALAGVVKPGGRAVILFPVLDDRRIPLPPALGKVWRILTPWQNVFSAPNKRGGLDYQRPNQRVGREIFLLERK